MDPERKSFPPASIVPITERKIAVRLPSEWLDRLFVALCEVDPAQEPEEGIGAILEAAASLVPLAAFGVRVPDPRTSLPSLDLRQSLPPDTRPTLRTDGPQTLRADAPQTLRADAPQTLPPTFRPAFLPTFRQTPPPGVQPSFPPEIRQSLTTDVRQTRPRLLIVRRTAQHLAPQPSDEAALFPQMLHESHFAIDFEPDAVLAIASNDPTVLASEGDGYALASRLALAIGAMLRTMRQQARASARVSEADDLRRHAVQNDKLAGLGKVVAGVVHELNNPITSILAYADLLRRKAERGALDAGDVERLVRIQEAAQRIHGFSRDLMAYSRPSTEVPVALSIHDVLDRSLSFCDHLLDRAQVTVERTFHPVKPVRGLGGQLTQVFVNLFTNAASAMDRAGGTLHIETTLDGDGHGVHIAVTDTGRGIGDDALPRIFEPFFTTSAEGEGTGLGLSIVRNIVEAHHGRVWAERGDGAGTTFHVVLPWDDDD